MKQKLNYKIRITSLLTKFLYKIWIIKQMKEIMNSNILQKRKYTISHKINNVKEEINMLYSLNANIVLL